jgi:hypothetical protein
MKVGARYTVPLIFVLIRIDGDLRIDPVATAPGSVFV